MSVYDGDSFSVITKVTVKLVSRKSLDRKFII